MRKSNALWGALLIFIGLVWILGTTNLVNIDIWGSVSTLWPVFIIAGGLTLFLKHESHLPRVIIWILVFALIGGYGVYLGYDQGTVAAADKSFEMKTNVQSASLSVSIGGATFEIGSSGGDLAQISTNVKGIHYELDEGPNTSIRYNQKMQFKGFGRKQSFKARLNNSVPWDIELNTGATSGSFDFSDLSVKSCTINTGACDLNITAGSKVKESTIIINGGALDLKLEIPEDVGLKISSSSALTNVNGSASMLKDGRVYTSENFDSAPNKLYLEITSGVCNISVNR